MQVNSRPVFSLFISLHLNIFRPNVSSSPLVPSSLTSSTVPIAPCVRCTYYQMLAETYRSSVEQGYGSHCKRCHHTQEVFDGIKENISNTINLPPILSSAGGQVEYLCNKFRDLQEEIKRLNSIIDNNKQ